MERSSENMKSLEMEKVKHLVRGTETEMGKDFRLEIPMD